MMAAKKKNVSKCILCIMSVKWHKTASSRGVCGVRAAAVPGSRGSRRRHCSQNAKAIHVLRINLQYVCMYRYVNIVLKY